jgi:hypothetical protein
MSASTLISKRIAELGDWRGKTLSRMRTLIKQAAPDVVEEWKWMNPVWSHDGIICTGEAYKKVVKLTFPRGASLKDPARLFNSSLEGKVRRALDIHEGEEIDAAAFKALVREAVALNAGKSTKKPALLAGGNPQIAKADGEAPVRSYLAAMPGWKRDVGRRLDALIVRTVPGVRKAVKWNSPFYGKEGQGWFLSFHCFTKYVRVAFFGGRSLRPLPPGESKQKEVRYLDVHEAEELDEKLLASWIRQASKLPGWLA